MVEVTGKVVERENGSGSVLQEAMQRAVEAARLGDKSEAYGLLSRTAEEYPDDPELWVWLGGTSPDLQVAEDAFTRAKVLDPSNERATLGLRWVHLRREAQNGHFVGAAVPLTAAALDVRADGVSARPVFAPVTEDLSRTKKAPARRTLLLVAGGALLVLLLLIAAAWAFLSSSVGAGAAGTPTAAAGGGSGNSQSPTPGSTPTEAAPGGLALTGVVPSPTAVPLSTDTPVPTRIPTNTPAPTNTAVPTSTPLPTKTPVPPPPPTATPRPAPPPPPPTATPVRPRTYVVRSGDSLYLIALRYGTTIPAIMSANRLPNNFIYPGEVLVIP